MRWQSRRCAFPSTSRSTEISQIGGYSMHPQDNLHNRCPFPVGRQRSDSSSAWCSWSSPGRWKRVSSTSRPLLGEHRCCYRMAVCLNRMRRWSFALPPTIPVNTINNLQQMFHSLRLHITQTNCDYVFPGPVIEGPEARRAGGKILKWLFFKSTRLFLLAFHRLFVKSSVPALLFARFNFLKSSHLRQRIRKTTTLCVR